MMEFAIAMGRLSADSEIRKKEREIGRPLTSEESIEIYRRNFASSFEAGLNAGVKRDMAMANLHMAQQPPIWIKPAMWGAVAFAVTLAAMVLS
jgi:hypothetical protein